MMIITTFTEIQRIQVSQKVIIKFYFKLLKKNLCFIE
jgi:hypothetical protein